MAASQGNILDNSVQAKNISILMRLSLEQLVYRAGYFYLQITKTLLKGAQIFKVPRIACCTRSSELDSPSAPVNQRRDDKGVEKPTFSSQRHNPNCLIRFFSPLFKIPWGFLLTQHVCNLLVFYSSSSPSEVDVKLVKGKNSVLYIFVSATEIFIIPWWAFTA